LKSTGSYAVVTQSLSGYVPNVVLNPERKIIKP